MGVNTAGLQAIRYQRGCLRLLDQRILPHHFEWVDASTSERAWQAIRSMVVRGAPAIAIAGALGVAAEAWGRRGEIRGPNEAARMLIAQLHHLQSSRPTAVNLFEAITRLSAEVERAASQAGPGVGGADTLIEYFVQLAEAMLERDISDNLAIGRDGAAHLLEGAPLPLKILTHCNTGSLATAGYGTALGVVRALHSRGMLERAFATETRPYNQGARLTAFELQYDDIPGTLIADSMAATVMERLGVDAVVVGADRIANNGDTANKIGTYQLAIVARHHKVPFYVAAPTTTLDVSAASGEAIPIEERPPQELTHLGGQPLAPEGFDAWNPAFDITPASLISGIMTERGVILPSGDGRAYDLGAWLGERQGG